ncbi:MAG: N-formylglutamate amidohydrolase [Cyclobacteriaceae bacterium]
MKSTVFVVTCEHAGNRVPKCFSNLFVSAKTDLHSHKGWDIGAIEIATYLAQKLGVSLFRFDYTRLLIEVNRSLDSPELFSKYSKELQTDQKQYLIDTYYQPYRKSIEYRISNQINSGHRVIHLSIHTFTPIWDGEGRNVDIGFLFDEARLLEKKFCTNWRTRIESMTNNYFIVHNQPYAGADDGLTTFLRTRFLESDYLGLEVEVNQKFKFDQRLEISDLLHRSIIV